MYIWFFIFIKSKLSLLKEKDILNLNNSIAGGNNITVITHHNPDGDAIGSALALYLYLLKKTNKQATVNVVIPNKLPGFLDWLPGIETVITGEKENQNASNIIAMADIIFCLDFNTPRRTGILEKALLNAEAEKILIDHHPSPNCDSKITLSNTFYSSTSELVYDVIKNSGDLNLIDKDIATCLFTGIMTDTGCFSFNSSSANTYSIISNLLGYGINKDLIYNKVYNNFSVDRMHLLGYCLNEKLNVLPEYQTAYISISKKEQDRFNYVPGDTEGFVNFPLSIKEIMFSVLFIEFEKYVKISLRSSGEFSANKFSKEVFNGGGHFNAAGAESKLSLQDTIDQFVKYLPTYINAYKKNK